MLLKYGLAGSLFLSGILGLLLLNVRSDLSVAKEVIEDLEGWQGQMVRSIGLASGASDVTAETAELQVQALGHLRISLNNANAAVERLAEEKRAAEEAAAREIKSRAAAIASAEATRDILNGRVVEQVPADLMEQEVRRAQDMSYEAGL